MATKTGRLNPQITTIEIGVRSLREVTIFPLSLADQVKMTRILTKAFQEVMNRLALMPVEDEGEGTIATVAKQLSQMDIAEFIVNTIQENLESLLSLVLDEKEKVTLEDLTNEQFSELVTLIYEVNYEKAAKNFMALVKRAKLGGPMATEKKAKKLHSKKSSPESVGGTTTG